eukprot:SAG31_NODE_1672_length_7564_cov_10.193704_8_plen_100_part_00
MDAHVFLQLPLFSCAHSRYVANDPTLCLKRAGESWTSATDISEQVMQPTWTWVATGPPQGVQLPSGRLMVCCDHEPGDPGTTAGDISSHSMWSDDVSIE